MGKGERPVTDREMRRVLTHLGFTARPRTGTSHEKWTNGARLVIVDAHHSPYHRRLLKQMLNQMGVSKDDFFRILDSL